MGDPDDHVVVFDVGQGVAALPEAAEENLVHEEPLDLVLDEQEMPEANRRIAANYRIPSLRYQRSRSEF